VARRDAAHARNYSARISEPIRLRTPDVLGVGARVTPTPAGLAEHVASDGRSAPPIASLRGAKVDADPRRVARAVLVVVAATLVGVIATLAVTGVQKNEQITELRNQGESVIVTVASCRGELGGSGSNVASYSCTGSYTVRGTAYTATLPGTARLGPGSTLRGVVSRSDPSLFTLTSVLNGEHASWRVFLAPLALAALLAVGLLALGLRRTRARTRLAGRAGYDAGGV
jgi:hypothetical protein